MLGLIPEIALWLWCTGTTGGTICSLIWSDEFCLWRKLLYSILEGIEDSTILSLFLWLFLLPTILLNPSAWGMPFHKNLFSVWIDKIDISLSKFWFDTTKQTVEVLISIFGG